MDVVLAISTMSSTTRIPSCRILFPAPLRFMGGKPPPPSSNLVGLGISSSVLRLVELQQSRTTFFILYYAKMRHLISGRIPRLLAASRARSTCLRPGNPAGRNRSEERRVGKECRARGSRDQSNKHKSHVGS